MRRRPFIVVAGNIGAGKSTVVARLSDELGLEPYYETDAQNPYLADFYRDMPRWALPSQLVFLIDGIKTNRRIAHRAGGAIEERSVFEHFSVFCHELRDQQLLSDRDFAVLADLYYSVDDLLTSPDLLVYLQAPVKLLHDRLRQRDGREPDVSLQYLAALDARYRQFLDTWFRSPVLRIDMAAHDVRTDQGLSEVAEIVTERLGDLV